MLGRWRLGHVPPTCLALACGCSWPSRGFATTSLAAPAGSPAKGNRDVSCQSRHHLLPLLANKTAKCRLLPARGSLHFAVLLARRGRGRGLARRGRGRGSRTVAHGRVGREQRGPPKKNSVALSPAPLEVSARAKPFVQHAPREPSSPSPHVAQLCSSTPPPRSDAKDIPPPGLEPGSLG